MQRSEQTRTQLLLSSDEIHAAVKEYVNRRYSRLNIPETARWTMKDLGYEISWDETTDSKIEPAD